MNSESEFAIYNKCNRCSLTHQKFMRQILTDRSQLLHILCDFNLNSENWMSLRDYLHERAEESRHNETLAYLMFVAGAVFFTAGVLETINTTDNPQWFLFIPYHVEFVPSTLLSLSLTLSGLSLLIYGVIAGLNYSHERAWYIEELHKAHSLENSKIMRKKRKKAT